MNSMIENYAREVRIDGKLTGHMYLNKKDALDASKEIIGTHWNWNSTKTNDWLKKDDKFEDSWNHFDVNKDG